MRERKKETQSNTGGSEISGINESYQERWTIKEGESVSEWVI